MLEHLTTIPLPTHSNGGFDHADVHLATGRVFVAHTANGTVEVIDGERLRHEATIKGCPEASGVICAQRENLVFAAARATGEILKIDAESLKTVSRFTVGTRPNGLAWDPDRQHLLIADVADSNARIVDPESGEVTASMKMNGVPRWCAYDERHNQFLVNIKNPPLISVLEASSGMQVRSLQISAAGPHGLQLDGKGKAFIACDTGALVELALDSAKEMRKIPISGPPDVLWYNVEKHELYCAVGKPGVVDVIDADRMERIGQIETEEGAHTLTLDARRKHLFSFYPKANCAEVFQVTSSKNGSS